MPREGLGELALAALDASADGFAVLRARRGPQGDLVRWVPALVNRTLADLLAQLADDGTGPDGLDRGDLLELEPGTATRGLWELSAATLLDGQRRRVRLDLHEATPDGPVLECLISRLQEELVVLSFRDISELAAGERLLAAAYEMTAEVRATLQTALDSTSDAFAVYDVERDLGGAITGLRLVLINLAGALPLASGDPDELVGQDLRDFYPPATQNGLWDAICQALQRQVTTTFRLTETRVSRVNAWDNTIAPVGDERVVITWRDVSDEVRRERELEQAHDDAHYAATHDPLTGLANRALLLEELAKALWSSGEDERVGVVFVDLDGFKTVNDRFGHAVGDELLQAVAARLLRVVRTGDTAARIGGDEFVLVLRRLPRDWDSNAFLVRAQAAMEEPLLLASGTLRPQASYGLVISPPAPRDLDRLMKLADNEMYLRKQQRRAGPGAGAEVPGAAAIPG